MGWSIAELQANTLTMRKDELEYQLMMLSNTEQTYQREQSDKLAEITAEYTDEQSLVDTQFEEDYEKAKSSDDEQEMTRLQYQRSIDSQTNSTNLSNKQAEVQQSSDYKTKAIESEIDRLEDELDAVNEDLEQTEKLATQNAKDGVELYSNG